MKKILMALAEKAVNLVWDICLKLQEKMKGVEVSALTKEQARRIKKNCVRW